MTDLLNSLYIASSGMHAQADRLRIVSENIANVDSVGEKPGDLPYRRKTISFKNHLDKAMGADMVQVSKVGVDRSQFERKYDPSHPAADAEGYILRPNINPMVELVDMKEARASYEANINVIEVSKGMLMQTVSLLK